MSVPLRCAAASDPRTWRGRTISIDQMQRLDRAATEQLGIPRLLLMEHAGLAVARTVQTLCPAATAHPVVICCGTGFNGGDGLAAARHLQLWGYSLQVVLVGHLEGLRDEPATYAKMLRALGGSTMELPDAATVSQIRPVLGMCSLVIDALLGIGMRGPVREPMATLIQQINTADVPVVAVDVPSGLDADTGDVHGVAVKATVTVTFGRVKHGCVLGQGPAYVGSLVVDPITLPSTFLEQT